MKKLQKALIYILVIGMVILPIAVFFSVSAMIPNQYDNTIYAQLGNKYNNLKSQNEAKIVLIGGSSVAFGYDSELLSKHLGKPVVNFGLYASLGTKVMMDLAEKYISDGDIVILMPEVAAQTYSLYFNGEATLQCLESNFGMIKDIKRQNISELFLRYPNYLSSKFKLYRTNSTPDPQDVYNSKNFNSYGDIVYDRAYNVMTNLFDQNNLINIDESLINQEFIDYVNKFYKKIKSKNAEMYFSFSPMNAASLTAETTKERINTFYKKMIEALDCRVITDINKCIIDAEYFYDTNYHLNKSGVVLKTKGLIEDIFREQKLTVAPDIEVPDKPEIPTESNDNENEESTSDVDKFVYQTTNTGVIIIGVKEEFINSEALIVPTSIGNIAVESIAENAFSECKNLKQLTIKQGKISLSANFVSGCDALTKIILLETIASKVTFSAHILNGTSGCKIYVPLDSYGNYLSDYYWSTMAQYLAVIE